jgi:predicted phage baseplate assembly protein
VRATTTLDFERLALDVPGTRVVRARAWADINPNRPGLKAPGTVTVVIVPELPRGRPAPSDDLRQAVHCYLDRRRIIGTRLVVVRPQYLEVKVRAKVHTKAGANPKRVCEDIIKALDAFLDPLQGGPNGRGWPFGRDVSRSEILQVIDEVPGVDHVLVLELIPDKGEARSGNGNLSVGPTWLVMPARDHNIQAVSGEPNE